MVRWGERVGLVPKGASDGAGAVEFFAERARDRFLTAEELGRLGDALRLAEGPGIPWAPKDGAASKRGRNPENRVATFDAHSVAAVRLLALTGARLQEVLRLRWAEVDLDRRVLRLADSKTGAKVIRLTPDAVAVLAALPRKGAYVIASESAGTKDEKPKRDLKRLWGAATRHAGLDGAVLHHLRHTLGASGASGNLSLHAVGALLGHRRASTTQRYAKFADDPLHEAAEVAAAPIARALGLQGAGMVDLAEERRARA